MSVALKENAGDYPLDLRPTGLYTAREAAAWLRLSNWKAIYEISEDELPRCTVGPRRGRIRYLGADLLCYVRGIEPINVEEAIIELKDRLSRPPSHTRRPDYRGQTRIL